MTRPVIGVVIPHHGGRDILREAVEALVSAPLPEHDLDIVVVDNASTDGSRDMLAAEFPAVRVIANADNRGFTPAINQGVGATRGAWALLLNNDVTLPAGDLAKMIAAAETGPDTLGGVQPLLVQTDAPDQVDSAGIGVRSRFRTHDMLMGQPAARAPREITDIWGCCAGCFLVRRAAFEEAGGFDEEFYAELDDVDFAFRARWLGWDFRLVPAARARHRRRPNAPRTGARKLLWVHRNGLWIAMKDLPGGSSWRHLAYRAQRDLLMTPHYLKRGQAGVMARSWREALAAWPGMARKRRDLLSRARRTAAEMRADLARFAGIEESW